MFSIVFKIISIIIFIWLVNLIIEYEFFNHLNNEENIIKLSFKEFKRTFLINPDNYFYCMRSPDFAKCLYYCDYRISFSFFDFVLFKYFIKNYDRKKTKRKQSKNKSEFMKNFEKRY